MLNSCKKKTSWCILLCSYADMLECMNKACPASAMTMARSHHHIRCHSESLRVYRTRSVFHIRPYSRANSILHAISPFSELQTRSLGREHRHNEAWHLIRMSGSGGESIRRRFSYAWIAQRHEQSWLGRSPGQSDAVPINFLNLKLRPDD